MSSTTCATVTVLQWKNSVSWLIGSGWYSGRQSFRFLCWFVQIRWRCKGWGGGLLIFFRLCWIISGRWMLHQYCRLTERIYATHYGLISTSHYGYGYWRANFPSLVYVLIVPLLILNFCWLLEMHWGASVALSIHHHTPTNICDLKNWKFT